MANELDIHSVRQAFPILDQQVNGNPLIYFDNAATTQKPKRVLDALRDYYEKDNANIHRGIHTLAERATAAYEETRKAVAKFINAKEEQECIFTKGTTEGINLVAQTFGRKELKAGDEVIISQLEHHSNIVPWQMICEEKGAVLKAIPINDAGELRMDEYRKLLSPKTKIVAVNYASNALGTINPIKEIIEAAHSVGARVVIDAAQAVAHLEIDVQALDCDFFAFSSHKMYGPTGVGVLYGKRELLEAMPPYQGGGEMIKEVTIEKTTWNEIPFKFEAGTPNIADVVAFRAAIEFINDLGKKNIAVIENRLLKHCTDALQSVQSVETFHETSGHMPEKPVETFHETSQTAPVKKKKIRLIGTAKDKVSVCSFVIEGMHPFDIGMMLDAKGIAVRTGHHCTQPLMKCFGIEGTVRASFAVYNTIEEVDIFVDAIKKLINR